MNLLMGLVLGLALGGSLVLVLQYLETATVGPESFNIIDRQTGAYTRSYLLHRLWAEASRARRVERPLSLGLLRVAEDPEASERHPENRSEAMRMAKTALARALREEDVLARFDQNTFVILLVDQDAAEARKVMTNALARVHSLAEAGDEQLSIGALRASIGLATDADFRMEPGQLLETAVRALETGVEVAVDAGKPEVTAPAVTPEPSSNGAARKTTRAPAPANEGTTARRATKRVLRGEAK
jgi:diguanylate cyclase (GGDEF)-like protein